MAKRFFKNLSNSFCIYLLAMFNLIHAVQTNTFDWLLWVSLALTGVSLAMNLVLAIKGGDVRA